MHNRFLTTLIFNNMYAGTPVSYLKDYERYYFGKRVQASKNGKGTRTRREVESSEGFHGGWWNATGREDKIYDSQNQLMGYKRTLKFHAYKDNTKNRAKAYGTEYIMHEYYLHGDNTVSFFSLFFYKVI